MSNFIELFEIYGFKVQKINDILYIADNGIYCIPFIEFKNKTISAVSFSTEDAEDIIEYYKEKDHRHTNIYNDYMRSEIPWLQYGNICNHDHTLCEIETWLKRHG